MDVRVFDFTKYSAYLSKVLSTEGEKRGVRTELAKFLKCQTSYISQVINDKAHLSLEYGLRVSEFLKHGEDERSYFMLLVQKGKAGSRELEQFYSRQLEEILEKRKVVKERIRVSQELKPEDQAIYYSAWYYVAIHILVAFARYQSAASIAEHLGLSVERTRDAMSFLVSKGIILETSTGYKVGDQRIHVGQDSPLVTRHHANWRAKTLQALDHPKKKDMHYSGVFGLSRSDYEQIRNLALDYLQRSEEVLKASKEESAYAVLLDLYEI